MRILRLELKRVLKARLTWILLIRRDGAAPHLVLHQFDEFFRCSSRQQLAALDDGVAGGDILHVGNNAGTAALRLTGLFADHLLL